MAECECLARINKELISDGINTNLSVNFIMRKGGFVTRPVLQTELVEKKRGAKPMTVVPTYCPFCGKKYPE